MSFLEKLRLRLPQLEFCCCGCSLKNGSAVIGWVTLIMHGVMTLSFASMADQIASGKPIPKHPDGTDLVTKVELLLAFSVSVLSMVAAVFLLLGVHKSKAKYLLPFLILTSITIIFEFLAISLGFLVVISELVRDVPPSVKLVEKLSLFFDGALNSYFLLVIHSYYNVLSQSTTYLRDNI